MKQQTAVEWLIEKLEIDMYQDLDDNTIKIIDQAKEMEKQQIIYLLETYHNRMFIIPLNEGEAERIYNHIKKTNESTTNI
jgi:hypothetical protein